MLAARIKDWHAVIDEWINCGCLDELCDQPFITKISLTAASGLTPAKRGKSWLLRMSLMPEWIRQTHSRKDPSSEGSGKVRWTRLIMSTSSDTDPEVDAKALLLIRLGYGQYSPNVEEACKVKQ